MQKLYLSCIAGLICCSAVSAADITGKWSGFPGFLVFQQNGAALTGTVGRSAAEQYPFEDGKIEGDRLSFKIGSFQADLRVVGEEIHGTIVRGPQTMKVVLTRFDEKALHRAFDVASVKRGAPASEKGVSSNSRLDPGRVTFQNVSLKRLITRAYDVKQYQVTAPDWAESENYDIVATFPAGTPSDQVPAMLQPLLAERFKLAFHREMKELPVYALLLDKGGLKLKPAEPLTDGTHSEGGLKGRKLTGNMSLARLAEALAGSMDRPVLDMTGVKGLYELTLEWVPDDAKPVGNDVVDGQSIYTALRQVGLKLEPRKAPIEIIVVDHAEKIPVEN